MDLTYYVNYTKIIMLIKKSGLKKVALDVSELSLTFDRAHAIVRGVVSLSLFFVVVTADHDATT